MTIKEQLLMHKNRPTAKDEFTQPYYIDKRMSDELFEMTKQSSPSDIIKLSHEADESLQRLWMHGRKDSTIPSDILFSSSVPLLDCKILIDETDKEEGENLLYRIVIFPDYEQVIRNCDENNISLVGAILFYDVVDDVILYRFICVVKGIDWLNLTDIYLHCNSKEKYEFLMSYPIINLNKINKLSAMCLQTWYGIQIALLHPTVKDVFRNPKIDRVYDQTSRNAKNANRKRITRYVKTHVLNAEDIKSASCGGKEYNRHTLVWYVIGHWRTLKDGRKIFVKPCWKGPLRELKHNLDDRERVIVTA